MRTRYVVTIAAFVVFGAASSPGWAQSAPADQSSMPQATTSTNGPGGMVNVTKTRHVYYGDGSEVDTSQTFHKSQSYTDANGQLGATTTLGSSPPVTTVKHPSP